MCVAPAASITRRSKPSAQPDAGGIWEGRQEILIDGITLAVDLFLECHLRFELAR